MPPNFLGLPLELRTEVYTLALAAPTPVEFCATRRSLINRQSEHYENLFERCQYMLKPSGWDYYQHRLKCDVPKRAALLMVSKQVHDEAAAGWYGQSVRFTGDGAWSKLRWWLDNIGPKNANLVTDLTVCHPFMSQTREVYNSVAPLDVDTAPNWDHLLLHSSWPDDNELSNFIEDGEIEAAFSELANDPITSPAYLVESKAAISIISLTSCHFEISEDEYPYSFIKNPTDWHDDDFFTPQFKRGLENFYVTMTERNIHITQQTYDNHRTYPVPPNTWFCAKKTICAFRSKQIAQPDACLFFTSREVKNHRSDINDKRDEDENPEVVESYYHSLGSPSELHKLVDRDKTWRREYQQAFLRNVQHDATSMKRWKAFREFRDEHFTTRG